jgi:hypothetical protein
MARIIVMHGTLRLVGHARSLKEALNLSIKKWERIKSYAKKGVHITFALSASCALCHYVDSCTKCPGAPSVEDGGCCDGNPGRAATEYDFENYETAIKYIDATIAYLREGAKRKNH